MTEQRAMQHKSAQHALKGWARGWLSNYTFYEKHFDPSLDFQQMGSANLC
jgi:hypothetical protein